MKLRRLGPRAIVLCAIALACCAVFGAASPSAVGATQTITLSADNLAPGAGDTVTLTATVTNSDGTTPSGTVKFFDGTVQMGDPVTLVPVPGSASQAVALFSTSFVAGPHSLTASYRNKSFITTTTPPLVLNVGHVATHPTTITLTSDPTVVVPGEPVTLTATVAAGGGAPVPTGLVSFDDNGVPFFPVSGGVLDASGHATLTVSGFGSGAHVIHASYPGDGIDSASAAVLNVTVPEQPQAVDTTVDVSVDPSYIHEGDAVTIVAHVQQVGAAISPPAGSLVSFYANDVPLDPANAPLDANGNATIVVSGGWQTGSDYKITATYVGDASFKTSSGDGFVSVLPPDAPLTVPTQLAYAGDTSGVYGTTAHLSGVLTTSAGPVANEPVVFTLGAQTCTGITDSTGLAACTVIVGQTPGNYTVDAAFAGDGLLLSTDITHAFAIGRQTTTLTYTGATSADYGDSATLSATLRDGPGAGLVGKSVTLALGSQTCPATTGPGGIASCTIAHVTQTPGSYTLTVSFAGDTVYFPSSASR